MAEVNYETVLEQARQLAPDEQRRLREKLAAEASNSEPSGARFIAILNSMPMTEADELDYQLMEQAIEAGCERIDPSES